ncbi:hypothetical protein RND81_10G102700 [Saponaria officinalis]|uniref:R13L1/DRL21-like LRR repeat region domain-containing protein n=1 Tax=Saponaria officinalis TaxID=3572 RepID=A0AAW1I2M5_SAPOF
MYNMVTAMITKRPLKTFPCPPNITEKIEEEERVKRVQESWDSLMDDRVNLKRLRLTDDQLLEETKYALDKLKTVSHNIDQKSRILYEDSRAKMLDGMEKFTTPWPFNKQVMFGRDKEISDIKAEVLKDVDKCVELPNITTLIGIGGKAGIGKTMLAQLIFDDIDVCNAFDYRHWMNCNDDNVYKFVYPSQALAHLCDQGMDERVLVVLDGCTQNLNQAVHTLWLSASRLQHYIKIIVTAVDLNLQFYGHISVMEPKIFIISEGLTKEESWTLFESLTFSSETTISKEERTKIINSEIISTLISTYSNNPCVINTIAPILSTKTTLEEWKHFLEVVLPSLPTIVETITSVFNLVAFKRLPFFMKRCLLFCSLFPKDYEFNRVDLNLWLARQFKFKNSSEDTVDVELSGDEYLRKLHTMGYFIEVGKIEDGTLSYKMSIFGYEFVKFVAKLDYSEYQSVGTNAPHIDPETLRHVSFIVDDASWHAPPWLMAAKNLCSFIFFGKFCERVIGIENVITSLKYLQILSINMLNCEHFLSYVGDLELLRSLSLRIASPNLPLEFITRMQNLSVFDFQNSNAHFILAEEFQQKFQSLRHLYLRCHELDKMTLSCGELVSLSKSNVLIMGQIDSLLDYNYILEDRMTNSLISDDILETIINSFEKSLIWTSPSRRDDDIVVKALQTPVTLESLSIRCWKGLTFPRFLDVVSIQIADSHECECISPFVTLPKLRSLKLRNLGALQYIQKLGDEANKATLVHFPNLETLMLANLPKLEAWMGHDGWSWSSSDQKIPQLVKLEISNTKLISLPSISTLESLEVNDISSKLLENLVSKVSSSAWRMKMLTISRIRGLDSLSIDLRVLESLVIRQCHELTTILVAENPTLKVLEIHECSNLKDPSQALLQMTQLNKLEIHGCQEIDLHDNTITWSSFNNLRHLKLVNLSKLESLPSGLGCLTALETMWICWVCNLKELPEWIGSYKHLQRLVVRNCPSLTRIPESLGQLLDESSVLRVEFRCCCALKKLPESLSRNQLSRLVIRECPKLEKTLRARAQQLG